MPEWNMGHVASYAELASLMTPRSFMVERGHEDGVAPDEVVITVWNAGEIPADVLPHVFEPFRGTKSKRSTGLGLGLYITQQIVEAHCGTIDVRSTATTGTSFVVRLPRTAKEP